MFWWAYILSYLCLSEAAAMLKPTRVSRKYPGRQSSKLINVLMDKRRKRLLGGDMFNEQLEVSGPAESTYLNESKKIRNKNFRDIFVPLTMRLYADWGKVLNYSNIRL